jgi:hypothetical protein
MNEFKVKKGLIVQGSGSVILDIQGSQGQLFSVTDNLSGSLFSVNDISGLPILQVSSDDSVKLGTFNAEAIKVSGSVAIITGSFSGSFTGNAFVQNGNSFGATALLGTNDNQSLALETSGSTRLFISSSGNVGIGTSAPTSKVQIRGNGSTSSTTTLRVENSNASASLVVLDNGNVGIGTTTPLYPLDVSGSIRTPNSTGLYMDTNLGNPISTLFIDSGNNLRLNTTSSGDFYFYEGTNILARFINGGSINLGGTTATASPVLKILSTGNVGIGLGTSSPTFKLDVSGSGRFTNGLTVTGSLALTGDITGSNALFTGTITAQKLVVQTITSSIIYSSGSNQFGSQLTDIQSFTGSLRVTGSGNHYIVGGNVGIGTTAPNAKLDVNGNTIITGSLTITGSVVTTGSVVGNVTILAIASNTASLNLNNGNFFTLQLVSGSNTYINPSNIKSGQTTNILLSTTGSATVSFPSTIKQVSGSLYVPTTTTGTDIVTLISFDNASLYLANVKNLV